MKQLLLDSNEAFEVYMIALAAVAHLTEEIRKDYQYEVPNEVCKADEKRLEVAKKLLDYARETSKAYLITEIENPF